MSVINISFLIGNIVFIVGEIILSATSFLIKEELTTLAVSLYCGIVLVICHDVLRIFRRVFQVSCIRYIIEDIIFGVASAIYVFNLLLKYNYGRIRYYSVVLILVIFVLKEWLLGSKLLDKIALIIKIILNKVTWLINKILNKVRWLINKILNKVTWLINKILNKVTWLISKILNKVTWLINKILNKVARLIKKTHSSSNDNK